MPEPITPPADSKAGDTTNNGNAGGTDPNQNKQPDNSAVQPFDPSKVSDEDYGKVFDDPRTFNHPRFKELAEKAKKAAEYEEKQQKDKEAKLVEDGKFKELLAEKENQIKQLTESQTTSTVNLQILAAAQKMGVIDTDAVLKLIDRQTIKADENGNVTGVAEALKALSESKAYLFKEGATTPNIGDGTNPGSGDQGGTKRFKLSQIKSMSPKTYQENANDIQAAMLAGTIEDDVSVPVSRP